MATSESPERASVSTVNTGPTAEQLRSGLVNFMKEHGWIRSPEIERAFLEIPREIFLPPLTPLTKVYSDEAIPVKWNAQEIPTSSSSQPSLMADMLEILELQPGMRVLEVGAGVGYNAALIAKLLGDPTQLTTVDFDPQMAQTAFQNLTRLAAQSGVAYDRVTVVADDGRKGFAPNAPYDRIIVTVQQWEISPEWVAQLKVGGRLLLPLTFSLHLWGGGALIPTFEKQPDGTLHTVAVSRGAFMYMQGGLAHPSLQSPVALPLQLAKVFPTLNLAESEAAKLLLAPLDLTPELQTRLQATSPDEMLFEGSLKLELGHDDGSEETKRSLGLRSWGFNLLLAAAFAGELGPLLLATLAPSENDSPGSDQTDYQRGWVRDGWRFRPAGIGYLNQNGVLLINYSNPQTPLEKTGFWLQAWRFPNTAGEPGLAKSLEVWQTWQKLGQPGGTAYRPIAYRVGTPPPVAGYCLPRRFYNLLFPT